ncbi:hypothetical protein HME9302_00585 [Alteripontixanthobacter maritimus]|uniref:DNA-(apurinic or apyrimidinic site) lyase n=1 Tax=Alteripontixanthobacter maritimus TaxID=2161824 RepID=A0A369Q7Y7_9SPHN|nr:hypothetical protein [Alteripontixanthobacter maritimus]RDC59397.1 hypothetical protein HME9302_00585 [Alteripontixanthobacter maritimus]
MHSPSLSTDQIVYALKEEKFLELRLPSASTGVGNSDLRWGIHDHPKTPAYWAAQSWMWGLEAPRHYKLGKSLEEELIACLLGGYGIPAEVGIAAYERIRSECNGCYEVLANEDRVLELLSTPLEIRGREVRYRFARQKAHFLAASFQALPKIDQHLPDRPLRDRITTLKGIGPKTASWVVRNWRDSDQVAILDIHIIRACEHMGLFEPGWKVERHYLAMEEAFLAFAKVIGARPSLLDSVMWNVMRELARQPVIDRRLEPTADLPLFASVN